MKKSTTASLTTQYIVLFAVLFLLANVVLGFMLHYHSSTMMTSLIHKNMLNLSNTAAAQIDGDVIADFTEKDVGSPAYNQILKNLSAFQDNADIKFIYLVRQEGEKKYSFLVDADPVDPGAFGEEIVVTPALQQAGKGTAAVDNEPAQDRWGNFYSSYSPVFDSDKKVTGIVGVDFSSAWYDRQVWRNTFLVNMVSLLFTLVGVAGLIIISLRVRRRFDTLGKELTTLSSDVEELTQEILTSSGYKDQVTKEDSISSTEDVLHDKGDEILALGRKIHSMHEEMERYLDYMHAQVNTDALTKVGNTTAYLERQKEIEAMILGNTASFSTVMFDINNLKHINDRYGHAGGDRIIKAAGAAVAAGFGKENTFRIGGDEFIAVVSDISEEEITDRISRVAEEIETYNDRTPANEATLSVSRGQASFRPGQDHSFRDVFVRADQQMYDCKDEYHHRRG